MLAEAQLTRKDDALKTEGVEREVENTDFFHGQALVMSSGEPAGAE